MAGCSRKSSCRLKDVQERVVISVMGLHITSFQDHVDDGEVLLEIKLHVIEGAGITLHFDGACAVPYLTRILPY
jgi:hypothetical protein